MFDFQKLVVYNKSKLFYRSCKMLTLENTFDKYVNDQLRRAAFSISLNIAEGSGKFSAKDRKNYFTISRASVFECAAVIDILLDEQKVSQLEAKKLLKDADELSRMLLAMIKNLHQKAKNK